MKNQSSQPKSTSERLAELLATEQLSPDEMQEFVTLEDKRILEPHDGAFVSKHSFTKSNMPVRLQALDWFAHGGKPLKIDLSMTVEQVANWEEATKHCNDSEWENATLEAQNQLSGWLHVHAHAEFQNWNDHVDDCNSVMSPIAANEWKPFFDRHNLDQKLLNGLRWNIRGAMMENLYMGHIHRCFFFHELLLVYEAGHFPCGWLGEWPQGKLLVY